MLVFRILREHPFRVHKNAAPLKRAGDACNAQLLTLTLKRAVFCNAYARLSTLNGLFT